MMSTAPRQRVRTAAGFVSEANGNTQQLLPRPKRRRGQRKKAHLLWEILGTTLLLVLLVVFAPRTTQQRGSSEYLYDIRQEQRGENPEELNITFTSPILTAFLEPLDTLQSNVQPLPMRTTSASRLTKIEYPEVQKCSRLSETFPIDAYPADDPFLPWIHDVFPTPDGKFVKIVAQNRRRCDTGKDHEKTMEFWEPQISLLQPVPIKVVKSFNGEKTRFRLASYEEADVKETRFLCRFHSGDREETTLSVYPFNYEYVSWRKNKDGVMFSTEGKDMAQFWLSQLYFSCPVPEMFQNEIRAGSHLKDDVSQIFMDVVPIRTPARNGKFLFTEDHVGSEHLAGTPIFDAGSEWGPSHFLPDVADSGRWANIPVCLPPVTSKRNQLAACTWTSMSYTRRGDSVQLSDTALRFREWIEFHSIVGFDQLYVYDNTVLQEGETTSDIEKISNEYPNLVTYHRWPCQICNNNRPAHGNPGERSSQYAAEASCRERYGPHTDWMATIDTDEYLVPMKGDSWDGVLDDMKRNGVNVLKMRSSRAKPRVDLMEEPEDQSNCIDTKKRRKGEPDSCLVPRKDETFLRVYNCEYIRPPRPDRFERAMKQIYRPSYVLSHFVHYSTVTSDVARLRKDFQPSERYIRGVQSAAWKSTSPEVFLNELTQGTLVHTRSVLPSETMRRTSECYNSSKFGCMLGYECPDSTEFVDATHQQNVFHDEEGNYCNCWINHRVEDLFVPKLEAALNKGMS